MKILFITILLVFMATLCACEPESNSQSIKADKENIMEIKSNHGVFILNNFEYLENTKPWVGYTIESIVVTTTDYNSNIINERKNVLKITDFNSNEVSPGMVLPELRIGEKIWENYSFSFSFFMGESSIEFSIYDETNLTDAPDFLGGEQYFWFHLKSNGQLWLSTSFGHGSYVIGKIDDFNPNVWNYLEIKHIDDRFDIYINETFVGTFEGAGETGRGRVALGGGVGVMFDNLYVEFKNQEHN